LVHYNLIEFKFKSRPRIIRPTLDNRGYRGKDHARWLRSSRGIPHINGYGHL